MIVIQKEEKGKEKKGYSLELFQSKGMELPRK